MSSDVEAYVAEVVATAPPLDDATREELARLLGGAR